VTGMEPLLRGLLGERVALVTNLDPATGRIRVDRSNLDQILINLTANALDAMPDGGTLVIETSPIDAAALDGVPGLDRGTVAMLSVADTGVGMSEAVRARVFEPFYTTKPFGEGTGLGLAMTYGIVCQSGGAITVDSTPGTGTTFRIYFPRVEQAGPPAPADGEPSSVPPPEAVPGTGQTVLVVEDEESVRTLAARMLERLGYRVLQAPNGAAAMSLVGTRLHDVDLLLSDVVMPGMRGPELAETLWVLRPDLPVVFMSGYTAGERGVADIPDRVPLLGKPFSIGELREVVGRLLAGGAGDGPGR
jgi:two-component system cell cycle sensor histidine kinase/response regulator CckA